MRQARPRRPGPAERTERHAPPQPHESGRSNEQDGRVVRHSESERRRGETPTGSALCIVVGIRTLCHNIRPPNNATTINAFTV